MSTWVGIDGRCFHCGHDQDDNGGCECDRKDIKLLKLQAAAENIIRKWRMKATLTDADIEWLENSLKKEETK